MLTDYIRAAMRKARYEILPDDGTFYGEIPGFDGVYANADTLESCREELKEILEEWIYYLRQIGFEGPYAGRRHQFMIRGNITLWIPNPHQGDIGESLLIRILKQAKIDRGEWEKL